MSPVEHSGIQWDTDVSSDRSVLGTNWNLYKKPKNSRNSSRVDLAIGRAQASVEAQEGGEK